MAVEGRRRREDGLLIWSNAAVEAAVLYLLLAAWARPRQGPAALLPLAACLAILAAPLLRRALESSTVAPLTRQIATALCALAWAVTAARLTAPAGYWQSDAPRAVLLLGALFGGPIPAGYQPLAFWAALLLWWRGHLLWDWPPSLDDALARFRLGCLVIGALAAVAAVADAPGQRRSVQLEQIVAIAAFFGAAVLTTGLSRRREMAGSAPAAPTLAEGGESLTVRRSVAPLLAVLAALLAIGLAIWGTDLLTPTLLAPAVSLGAQMLGALGAALVQAFQSLASLWPSPTPTPAATATQTPASAPVEPLQLPQIALPDWVGPALSVAILLGSALLVARFSMVALWGLFAGPYLRLSAVAGDGRAELAPVEERGPIAVLARFFRLFRRALRGSHAPTTAVKAGARPGAAEPSVSSIRSAYRELLRWAASQGWARQLHETPDEFRRRLVGLCPHVGAEVTLLTSLYVAARYGGRPHAEVDVRRARVAVTRLRKMESQEQPTSSG